MAVSDRKLRTRFSKYIYLSRVSEVTALRKVLMKMLVYSVQKISPLDSQSTLWMFTLFSGRLVGLHGGTPI